MNCKKILLLTAFFSAIAGAGTPNFPEGYARQRDFQATGKGYGLPSVSAPARIVTTGKLARVAPTATGYGISYHGGAVMAGPVNVYLIWYGWPAVNPAVSIVEDMLRGLSGSPYMQILTTYSTSAVTVSPWIGSVSSTFEAAVWGASLTDAVIYKIVAASIKKRGIADPNGVYFVLTAPAVSSTGFCSSSCGWHTASTISATRIKYAFVGDPSLKCPGACGAVNPSPNGNPGADAMAMTVAHELVEAITDPELTAWYDSRGYENADKCAWKYGTVFTLPNGARWNIQLGSRRYLLSQNWVNAKVGTAVGYCDVKW